MDTEKKPLMNSREAAAYLTISEPTFFRLVRAGKIHKSQIGPNVVRYTLAELDRYIASVTSTAEGITE